MTIPKKRKPSLRSPDRNVIETFGEDFVDGYHLDLIGEPASDRGLQLIGWGAKKTVQILPQITRNGRTYCPVTLSPSLLRSTRLPVGIGQLLKAAELQSKIADEFRRRIGLPVDDSDRVASVCISTWFADILPTVPSLWISGEDAQLGVLILRLAGCFCRRPLLLGSIARSGWNFVADFHPTLLIFDDGESRAVEAGLRTSSFRGVANLDGHGINNFCASKIVFSLSSTVCPSLADSAVLVTVEATPNPNFLSDFELNRLSNKFQALLLRYRIANWQAVVESRFDVPEFTSPHRAIASALGACISHDRDLQARYISLIRSQDDAARAERSVSPESCLTEILLGLVHLDPTAESFRAECLAVKDIAKSLNTLLRERGILKEYSPEDVGWRLKRLGIPKLPRDKAGVKIALGKETNSRVHALARKYEVSLISPPRRCAQCASRQV